MHLPKISQTILLYVSARKALPHLMQLIMGKEYETAQRRKNFLYLELERAVHLRTPLTYP
jgi:hypothetical protein